MRRWLEVGIIVVLATGCEPAEPAAIGPAADGDGAPATVDGTTAPNAERAGQADEPVPNREKAAPVARLVFVGDMSFSSNIAGRLHEPVTDQSPLFPFGAVHESLASADLTIGNFECVIREHGDPQTASALAAPPAAAVRLADAGFDLVTVANNHALDFGHRAHRDTAARLRESGVAVVGERINGPFVPAPHLATVGDQRFAFLAYHDVLPENAEQAVRESATTGATVIVYMHWGTEYSGEPTRYQRELGERLTDAGAALVVGTHTHVVQPEEWFGERLVAYGLGNFVFAGMTERNSTRIGAVLEASFVGGKLIERAYRTVTLDRTGRPTFTEAPIPPTYATRLDGSPADPAPQ